MVRNQPTQKNIKFGFFNHGTSVGADFLLCNVHVCGGGGGAQEQQQQHIPT
jgi:hypothetical protein